MESLNDINRELLEQPPPQVRETDSLPDNDRQPSEGFEVDMPHHYQPLYQRWPPGRSPDQPAELRSAMSLYEKRENGPDNLYRHLSDELDLYYGAGWENDVWRGKWTRIVWPKLYERHRREMTASRPAAVESLLASRKSMADFLARRKEYLQNCQQALEAGLVEAKIKVAQSLACFMAGGRDSKDAHAERLWLAKIDQRLASTTVRLHDPLSPLVGSAGIDDWLDSPLLAAFELSERRIGVPLRSFLTTPETITTEILSHEVMHAAGVVAVHKTSQPILSGAPGTEQSCRPKTAGLRSGLYLEDYSTGASACLEHGSWLNEALIDSFGMRWLGFREPAYLYGIVALRTLDCLQPGLEDALLRAAIEGSSLGEAFGMVENWLGPLGVELFQDELRQLAHRPPGQMISGDRVPDWDKHISDRCQLLGDYFLDLLAPNVTKDERVAAGQIWQTKTEEIISFYQQSQQEQFETDVLRHIAQALSA